MQPHKDSLYGRAAARVTALEAGQDEAAARVVRRKTELTVIWDDLSSLSLDANVDEVAKLVTRELAMGRLVKMAGDAAVQVARDLGRVRGILRELEKRRSRLAEEISLLDDLNERSKHTPTERASHLALARWQLAVLVADPEEVAELRAIYLEGPPVVRLGNKFNLDIYEKDIAQIAGTEA